MLNMTNAQLHQCVHCSRVGDYDLIIPFTLSLSARTTPSKVPGTTCSSYFHRPDAVKGGAGQRKICPCLPAVAPRTENTSPQAKNHPTKLLQSPMPHKTIPNPPPRMISITLITLLPRMFSLHGTILNKRVKRWKKLGLMQDAVSTQEPMH